MSVLGCCNVLKFLDSCILKSWGAALILLGFTVFLWFNRVGSYSASTSLLGSYQSLNLSLALDLLTSAPFFFDLDLLFFIFFNFF